MTAIIDIGTTEAFDVLVDAEQALIDENDPPVLFQRGSRLVRLYHSDGLSRAVVHGDSSLRLRLAEVVSWGRWTTGANVTWRPAMPPLDVAKMIRAKGEYPDVPALDQVVTAPVVGADGCQLVDGYNATSRVYLARAPDLKKSGGGMPVPHALSLLDDLLADFPLVSEADRANTLALMLTPLLRGLVRGPTPLFLVSAAKEGVGKTLLARVALFPVCGWAEMTTVGHGDEEIAKALMAVLRQAPTAVLLDNLSGELDSPALARALTAPVWMSRILGKSEVATLPVQNTWVATANNLRLSGELVRRVVPVRLKVPDEHRQFRHTHLEGWAAANRNRLFGALMSLVEYWQEEYSGEIARGLPALPSYEGWVAVVGSVLKSSGVTGFLANLEEARKESNAEDDELAGLLDEWSRAFGDRTVATHEVIARSLGAPGLAAALPSTRSAYVLGKHLQRWKDRPVNQMRLVRRGRGWSLEVDVRECSSTAQDHEV